MKNRSTTTDCLLCGKEKAIRRSHVIPEFLYRPMYDAANRALMLTASTGESRPVQHGFWAPILGKTCEDYVNEEFEQPFRRWWFEQGNAPAVVVGAFHDIPDCDYRRVKLFLLSILFRAGVCTVAPYAVVTLGQHETKLREMLLNGDANSRYQYPIIGSVLHTPNTSQVFTGVVPPFQYSWSNTAVYAFVFGGCLWEFPLTLNGDGEPFMSSALTEDGHIRFRVIDLSRVKPLWDAFTKFYRGSTRVDDRE
jgi:hypothetical protein